MNHLQLAEDYHQLGYGCSQSVLAAFCQDFGLEEKLALKIANGFGSGMGRLCQVCGSLTGGFMVIGLKYGRWEAGVEHSADTEETYRLVRLLAERFEARNGTLQCRELLGLDLNDPDQRQFAVDQGLFKTKCSGYIQDVVQILEEIL